MERIKACGAISIYSASQGPTENAPQSPVFKRTTKKRSSKNTTTSQNVVPPPPQIGGNVLQILDRYKHLFQYELD